MHVKLSSWLLIIFAFGLSKVLKAQPFFISKDFKAKDLNSYLFYKVDTPPYTKLNTVLSSEDWIKNTEGTLNFGFTFNNYWIKTSIANQSDRSEFLLEIKFPFLDTLEVYVQSDSAKYSAYIVGDRYVFSNRIFEHKNFIIPITIKPKQIKAIYFYLRCNGEATSFPVRLITREQLDKSDSNENLALGAYYGVIAFALFLSFFMGIFLKEITHFYYLIYLVFAFLFQFSLDGLSFQYLWPNNIWLANHIIPISGSLSLLFLLIFAGRLLATVSLGKFPFYAYYFFIALLLVEFAMVLPENKLYSYSISILSFTALVIDVFLFYVSIVSALKGNTSARYFITAFGFLLLMIVLAQLKNFGFLPRIFITAYGIQIGSAVETILLSLALSDRIRSLQVERNLAQQKLLDEQAKTIRLQQKNNEELEFKIKERTQELIAQKRIIEEKNKDISDSINYAERIQRGILQDEQQLKKIFSDSFILFKPKDIVSGDFYWFADLHTTPLPGKPSQRLAVLAVIDCTGHGIPGAFMSMVGNAILNQTLKNPDINSPSEALNFLNEGVVTTVTKKGITEDNELIKDGMDIAMVAINAKTYDLWFSGANNPCYIVRKGTPENDSSDYFIVENSDSFLIELKPDKQAIGVNTNIKENPFTNKHIKLLPGDAIYLFSDGYADQFGGTKSKKFTTKKFKETLCRLNNHEVTAIGQRLWETHCNWKGDLPQIDDICVLGLRIP